MNSRQRRKARRAVAAASVAQNEKDDSIARLEILLSKRCASMPQELIDEMNREAQEKKLSLHTMVTAVVLELAKHKVGVSAIGFAVKALRPNWLGLQLPDLVRGVLVTGITTDILEMKRQAKETAAAPVS